MNILIFIINKFHTYNNSMIYNLLMLQKYKITKDNKEIKNYLIENLIYIEMN